MEKGIEHVLRQNNPRRKQILKYHFGISAGLYKMKISETEEALRKAMGCVVKTPEPEQGEPGVAPGAAMEMLKDNVDDEDVK